MGSASTDAEGRFVLENLQPGVWALWVHAPEHRHALAPLVLEKPERTLRLEARLGREKIRELKAAALQRWQARARDAKATPRLLARSRKKAGASRSRGRRGQLHPALRLRAPAQRPLPRARPRGSLRRRRRLPSIASARGRRRRGTAAHLPAQAGSTPRAPRPARAGGPSRARARRAPALLRPVEAAPRFTSPTATLSPLRHPRRIQPPRQHPGHENDRLGLETLCRYGARGALSLERLSRRDDGTLAYRMKRPAPDGSTHLLLTPLELVRKLAALVPPPWFNLTRFHGVFAPNSSLRAKVVPTPPPPPAPPAQSPAPAPSTPPSVSSRKRLPWAELLRLGADHLRRRCAPKRRCALPSIAPRPKNSREARQSISPGQASRSTVHFCTEGNHLWHDSARFGLAH